MNRKITSSLLAVFFVFALTGTAFAWGSSGGDGSDFGQLQEKAVFFNNSGGTLTSGTVVILDRSGTGVTAGTTLGAYVTTTTSDDSIDVVGVSVTGSSLDQTPIVVVTKGAVDTLCAGATDAPTSGVAVGTSSVAGQCGTGTNLGVALEASATGDSALTFIWVSPTGAD